MCAHRIMIVSYREGNQASWVTVTDRQERLILQPIINSICFTTESPGLQKFQGHVSKGDFQCHVAQVPSLSHTTHND